MSANKKPRARPVKPKTMLAESTNEQAMANEQHAVENITALATEQPVTEQPATEQPATEQPSTEQSSESAPKKRAENKISGISVARTRRHLDKLNINAEIDKLIHEYKTQLKACETLDRESKCVEGEAAPLRVLTVEEQEQVAMIPDLTARLSSLSKERVRFSNEATHTLSAVCDELVVQLVAHSANVASAQGLKTVKTEHLYDDGIEKLPLWPLIKNLPVVITARASHVASKQLANNKHRETCLLKQAEKDFRKKYGIKQNQQKAPTNEAAVQAVNEPQPVNELPTNDQTETDPKVSFKYYIQYICKTVLTKNPSQEKFRVLQDLKNHISDVLIELIKRLSTLVLVLSGALKNKTVTGNIIMKVIESILVDCCDPREVITIQRADKPDPAWVAQEEAKLKADKAHIIDHSVAPKVLAYSVTKEIVYPSSGFAELKCLVSDKLTVNKTEAVEVSA